MESICPNRDECITQSLSSILETAQALEIFRANQNQTLKGRGIDDLLDEQGDVAEPLVAFTAFV